MEANTITRKEELLNLVTDLNGMILNGQVLEAHDKFYANDVIQMENSEMSFEGKELNRKREEEWVNNIVEFRGAEVKSIAVDEANDITMVEWFMDYTHKNGDPKPTSKSVSNVGMETTLFTNATTMAARFKPCSF